VLNHLEAVFYTLAFIVPGFVLDATYHVGARQLQRDVPPSMVRFLTLSGFNYALWAWLVYLMLQPSFLAGWSYRVGVIAGLWGWIILGSPAVCGLVLARLNRTGMVRRALRWLGLKPLHQVPAAWDYVFHDLRRVVWVYVTLKDGSTVAGLMSSRSFASSDPSARDLFLERIYRAEPEMPWEAVPGSAGILICAGEIRHIEMWENDGVPQ
jgi:hypothetical protein